MRGEVGLGGRGQRERKEDVTRVEWKRKKGKRKKMVVRPILLGC